ncbi:MAG: 3-deoxy-D-manno-octulosonic acid transferase [Xanthobacteraceae bacterium]|nr:3-deoxy-D-manno-octulosonic acid transferase [Xanthobacteraceae bacterium]
MRSSTRGVMPANLERLPATLAAYRAVSGAATPLAPRLLHYRLRSGKEHADRMAERLGEPGAKRPSGPLVWIHGASVGELAAVLPLIERMRTLGLGVLATTGTVTSAALAERRLPPGALHQFIPLDLPPYVARFLDHWRPDLVLFVESDLWPNLIMSAADRKIPMILVNGRMSARSFRRWRNFPRTIEALLRRFDLCLARTPADAGRFGALGAGRIATTGNLKLDVPPLPVDSAKLAELAKATEKRIIIAAASTHPGEEGTIFDAHRRVAAAFPALLTVVAPRHPQRGAAIAEIATAAGLRATLRSRGELPGPDTDIYLFDTLGELGMLYEIAPIVLMGGSLIRHGGQNPIEAVPFGAAILHGPHVDNFAEIYDELDGCGGACVVTDAGTLATGVAAWIEDGDARARAASAARECVERLGGALERTIGALEPYFTQLRIETAGDA